MGSKELMDFRQQMINRGAPAHALDGVISSFGAGHAEKMFEDWLRRGWEPPNNKSVKAMEIGYKDLDTPRLRAAQQKLHRAVAQFKAQRDTHPPAPASRHSVSIRSSFWGGEIGRKDLGDLETSDAIVVMADALKVEPQLLKQLLDKLPQDAVYDLLRTALEAGGANISLILKVDNS